MSRMRLAGRIGRALERAALQDDDAEGLAVADMILEAARPENLYAARDMHNADGELFDGYGSAVIAPTRLDPAYMKASSARARKKARAALERCRPQAGERLRFVTLTLPDFGLDFVTALEVLSRALVLFKKRAWFKRTVRGAVIGDEVTGGADGGRAHVHAHMVTWSKWIVWAELGEQWTACVMKAAQPYVDAPRVGTAHGRAVVDVRLVTSKGRGKGTISLNDAVTEVCKYTVKGSDFERLPPAQLCAVERALYRRRMVETYGECNAQRGRACDDNRDDGDVPYLDTQCTTDGGVSGKVEKSVGVFPNGVVRSRTEPLRVVGARMIREGKRYLWVEMLRHVYAVRREWRKGQLAARYPLAVFRFLDGDVRHGVTVQAAQ